MAGAIPKGYQALTVSLDPTHAAGGFVTPGDKVNLLVNLSPTVVTGTNGTPTSVPGSLRTTAFLLPGLKVIAVGSTTVLPPASTASNTNVGGTTSTTTPQAQPASLITLQVTPRQAEQIVQATSIGTLYMSLNPPDFKGGDFTNPTEIVEAVNLFDQPLTEVNTVIAALPKQP